MTRRTLAGLILNSLLLSSAHPGQVQSRTIIPRDESARDPTLAAFLGQLRGAVRSKDADAIRGLISDDIKSGFGGEDGAAEFDNVWRPGDEASELWTVLNRILAMGGDWYGPSDYCVPYLFMRFPDDLDPFDYEVVTGRNVRLRAAPGLDAPILRTLDYEIVRVEDMGEDWHQVTTLAGEQGYVAAEYLHSPVGYRACFVKDGAGEWRMRSLLAGD